MHALQRGNLSSLWANGIIFMKVEGIVVEVGEWDSGKKKTVVFLLRNLLLIITYLYPQSIAWFILLLILGFESYSYVLMLISSDLSDYI